jgi:hypothetical protein
MSLSVNFSEALLSFDASLILFEAGLRPVSFLNEQGPCLRTCLRLSLSLDACLIFFEAGLRPASFLMSKVLVCVLL